MKTIRVIKTTVFLVISILFITNVSAETLESCMQRKSLDASPSINKDIFSNAGCNTAKTSWDGKRKSCRKTLCWFTPPNHVIIESSATSHSASGSEHSFTGPSYEPTRDAATKVCYSVVARSPQGLAKGKGWQKINATAKIKLIPNSSAWVTYARTCLAEGAK